MKTKKYSGWITLFGICLIISPITQINYYFNYTDYRYWFRDLPDTLILIRYIFSIAFRALTVIAGIGVLHRINIFRKLSILMGFFTIITIYWKHPVQVFRHTVIKHFSLIKAHPVIDSINDYQLLEHTDFFIIASMIVAYAVDLIFAALLIYCFTRPEIKKQFN